MNKERRPKSGITLLELLVSIGMIVLLSGTIYKVLRSVHKTFSHARNKLDILQTTRVIMSGIRNELRNAIEKPQVINGRLNIPLELDRTVQYYFDDDRRLFRVVKGEINAADPDVSEMHPFMFDDGQILEFAYDSSYKDSDAFVESELTLNSKVWFKVSMRILYTEKFNQLSAKEKEELLKIGGKDPRVRSFFMMITPRKVNWLLQATQ